MFSGQQLASMMLDIGITHVVTLPDSTIGVLLCGANTTAVSFPG